MRDQQEGNGADFTDCFYGDKPSCPWMRRTDQALNSHQVESRDVTPRHIFWANCCCSEIKTPLQLHADYESNNTANKCMFPKQFDAFFSCLRFRFCCLPSNMWQELNKLRSACCTVRRPEFSWGYDSGFGSAPNFWHCNPLQPRPWRSQMCDAAIDETPNFPTSPNTPQRGRALSWIITAGWISAKVTCDQTHDECYQKGTLSL